MSSGSVILSKVVPCPLPSYFITAELRDLLPRQCPHVGLIGGSSSLSHELATDQVASGSGLFPVQAFQERARQKLNTVTDPEKACTVISARSYWLCYPKTEFASWWVFEPKDTTKPKKKEFITCSR